MIPRYPLALMAAIGVVLAACVTTDDSPPVDDALMALENQMASAADFETLDRLGNEALTLAGTARTAGDDDKALVRATASARAWEAASYAPDVDDESVLTTRTKALSAADFAWRVCEEGAPDPTLGNHCAYAAAVKRINDSVIAGHVLEVSVRKSDWDAAEQSARAFQSSVETAWPAYSEDVAGLANSEMNATPFQEMVGRSACNFQRRQGLAGLMAQHARSDAAKDARRAYLTAAASASAYLDLDPQGNACTDNGEDALTCKGARERALGAWCDRFNQGSGA